MGIVIWAQNPWGQEVPIHIAWYLIRVSLFAGLAFLIIHAVWVRFRPVSQSPPEELRPDVTACIPEQVPRHSLAARIFHWLMAAAMLTLLFSAFLPKSGVRFSWVYLHWTAGVILTLSIVFHIIHSIFCMEFRSIWPDREDFSNGWRSMLRVFGMGGRTPGKPGKYPLGNKLYHLAIMVCGLCMAATGILLLWRVSTPFVTRNPYILSDMTWGTVYLLHGFAGTALVALVIIHVYFALRPEKLPITKAMVSGFMDREYYLKHHDPRQWACDYQASQQNKRTA